VIDVLHTPGHTPEHLSFLVTDGAAADRPLAALTGDFVFVGDVGRPDLLERAAGVAGTMEGAARALYRSLQAFKRQPDYLQIWPGHGAGSACGKGLSAIPHSTVGYERMFNWAFNVGSEDEFVRAVLSGQPEPPRYFAEMKRVNRDGPALLGGVRTPARLPDAALARLLEDGEVVVDLRPAEQFAHGHVPGTLSIPLNRSFTTWAGSLLPYGRDVHLLVDEGAPGAIEEAVKDLALIGLDRVAGYFGASALQSWVAGGAELQVVPQIGAGELAKRLADRSVFVLDVRGASEWEAGRLAGVASVGGGAGAHLPLGTLPEHLDVLPRETPIVTACRSGARSTIAAGLLQAHGFRNVMNLSGGLLRWRAAGLPMDEGASTRARVA
jgi:hydroxyacylglutathione hydrolase